MLDTLRFVSEEFDRSIANALKKAGTDPSKRLAAIIDASLDPDITEHRKMAVWHAFDSESRGRQDYQRIRGSLDKQNFKLILNLCEQIIKQAGKQSDIDARAIANAISGITEEVWKEILFAGEEYDRDDARYVCLCFLASIFPWCYEMPSKIAKNCNPATKPTTITKATTNDINQVARLFDLYRQFYEQDPDLSLAQRYISEQITNDSSVIFIAWSGESEDRHAVGFTQLYSSFCSVEASPIWVLYDLFVEEDRRGKGIGKSLMQQAHQMAAKSDASRIDLETAFDNVSAQALYESLGYQKDNEFYKYSLEL